MRNLDKYKGVIPAFYACYDKEGNISPEGVQALTKYFIEKGVKGVYVNGSSGECIYQSVEDKKIVLENVMKAAEGRHAGICNGRPCNLGGVSGGRFVRRTSFCQEGNEGKRIF